MCPLFAYYYFIVPVQAEEPFYRFFYLNYLGKADGEFTVTCREEDFAVGQFGRRHGSGR